MTLTYHDKQQHCDNRYLHIEYDHLKIFNRELKNLLPTPAIIQDYPMTAMTGK
jgi:hypothetical protein